MIGKKGAFGPPIPPPPYVLAWPNTFTLSYEYGAGPSASSPTFRVYSENISSNITLTAAAELELSNDGVSWSGVIVIPNPGVGPFISASIYRTRVKAGLAVGMYSYQVSVAATGATTTFVNVNANITVPVFDPDAVLYFNQLTGTVPDAFKISVNNLIISLKSGGNFSEMDRFWIHATPNQQNARISVVNPTSTAITEVNGPTWTQYVGYTGNGITNYLDTNFIQNLAIKYTQNSASFGNYCLGAASSIGIIMGTGPAYSYPQYLGGNLIIKTNGLEISSAVVNARGFSCGVRTGVNSQGIYRNGLQLATGVDSSVILTSNNWAILAFRDLTVSDFSAQTVSISFIGSSAINQASLYASVQAFATEIGFNV